MFEGSVQERSELLAARVEALAAALQECGVAEEASARLLASASSAVLQALTLELLLERREPVAAPEPEVQPELPAAPDVPLAA